MSARYKISNRNIYGFRTNMYQMMFLLIPLLIALSLLAEFVLGPVLYGFYQKDATLEEGAAGTQAGADVQVHEMAGALRPPEPGDTAKIDVFQRPALGGPAVQTGLGRFIVHGVVREKTESRVHFSSPLSKNGAPSATWRRSRWNSFSKS